MMLLYKVRTSLNGDYYVVAKDLDEVIVHMWQQLSGSSRVTSIELISNKVIL